jgi:hypothetical protein
MKASYRGGEAQRLLQMSDLSSSTANELSENPHKAKIAEHPF